MSASKRVRKSKDRLGGTRAGATLFSRCPRHVLVRSMATLLFQQTCRHDSCSQNTLSSCQIFSGVSANSVQPTDEMVDIVHLPEELVQNIASWLGSDGKFSLRLTCRDLESKSRHEFASAHFSKKCVQFTTDSLEVLVEISKSRLSKYVREVFAIAALFTDQCFVQPINHGAGLWPDERQAHAYRNYVKDQASLRRSGGDLVMLTEAFKSFQCLKTVGLVDSEDRLEAGTDYRGGRKVPRVTGQYCSKIPGLTPPIVLADPYEQVPKPSVACARVSFGPRSTSTRATSTMCGTSSSRPLRILRTTIRSGSSRRTASIRRTSSLPDSSSSKSRCARASERTLGVA